MPLYEYKCGNCSETFEVIQKFSDDPLTVHEKCGGGPVERLISPPAFQFKGSGWYITDYAKGNGSSTGKADSKSPAKTEGSGGSEGSSTSSESSPSTPAASSTASTAKD